MNNVVVIGSGMAGYGAATVLHTQGQRPVVYEKSPYYGGHTASFVDKGFLFDLGPHISFTKDERIQKLLAGHVDNKYEALQVKLDNYWKGLRLTHPVQLHLHGLPHDLIIEVITDFVKEHAAPEPKVANYEEWLIASYGRKFAETFPMTYARKYHTTDAKNMSTDWLGPRMYRPSLQEMLRGALGPWSPDVHYITHFRYPTHGGFFSYLKDFPRVADIKLEHEVAAIDPKARQVRFANGATIGYGGLVSSIALPALIPMIAGAPQEVLAAARRLAATTCVLVNVGVNRADLSEGQITYIYDEDIVFTRLSFPHMLSATNAPPGCGSIQAEVYFSDKYRPLQQSPEQIIERVIADLRRCGTLREDDQILFRGAKVVRYANVIFDLERAAAVKTVHGYLDDVGIRYCGRYGDWGYMWTDESYISGERAAEKALSTSRPARRDAVPAGANSG
ncbi:MAG TPA: FAD-dependent oxidoreductase [Steroidobacteraceae bacterium]|nr:FAD-dependent oxidoreductase [Steroidobacteraceae bacterium]